MWQLVANAALAVPPANIVGGEVAAPGAWPDVVAIEYPWGIACTGTLVAPDLVLTAGHCVSAAESAIVGAIEPATEGERIAVIDAWSHEDYVHTYDVGLLVLERPVSAAPRAVVRDCLADALVDGAPVTLAGYGAINEAGTAYDGLLHVASSTIDDADCDDPTRGCNPQVAPGGELVAGGDGVDSCNGDSGGPLFVETAAGVVIAGVTSRAAQPAERVCGDGGLYARVDAIVDWIEESAAVTLARPACEGWNAPPAPTAGAIEVLAGESATTAIAPNDPNPEDAHTYALAAAPRGAVGFAPDGTVTYTAPADLVGADDFAVTVTDDGVPPRSAVVEVRVDVRPQPVAQNGCATAPGASWLMAAAGLHTASRRRSARPRGRRTPT